LATGSYAPSGAALTGAGNIEALGKNALDIGSSLGGGNTASANALLSGGTNAANTLMAANAYNPMASALSGLGSNKDFTNALAGMFGGYNPGNWTNPAGNTGYYKYGGSNLDVGNMS
jgi:hypothetical protein